jgi:hypothetical protein
MRLLLEWKVLRIEYALKSLLKEFGIQANVWSFGAYYIDPRRLAFVIAVPLDIDRAAVQNNRAFISRVEKLLVLFNWDVAARDQVRFHVESQETVDREDNGNWLYHFR